MADYDDVVVSALTDEFNGWGREFSLSDWITGVHAHVIITYKGTVTDKRGDFEKTKLEIEITQEYYTDIEDSDTSEQIKSPEILTKAIKIQLSSLNHYYHTSYDEGDIAHISLIEVVFNG